MEKEKQTSISIWHRDLNLVFVYAVIFLVGLVIIGIMTSVLNDKVQEITGGYYTSTQYEDNM